MSKGYLIAHLKENDQEGMDKFKQMSGPTIGEHGGKVLVREPSLDVREGENLGTVVLIEFESIDAARKFYESEKYQAAKAVRELAAKAHLVLVEGIKTQIQKNFSDL